MKRFILMSMLVVLLGMVSSAQTTTNVINIYNSQVTINNTVATPKGTNDIQRTTRKMVIIPREHVERLQWESMLDARRRAAFQGYLKKFNR